MTRSVLLTAPIALAAAASARGLTDYMGHGISKSTYACSDPFTGLDFMLEYFPAEPSQDSCTDNMCWCYTDNGTFAIEQGRVQLDMSSTNGPPGPTTTEGFGMHLVNVSGHYTTGGMSVAQVEAEFTSKLSGMSSFDWFMDYNIGLYTTDIDSYISSFDSGGVDYFTTTWSDEDGVDWYGVFVHVAESQMVIELMSNSSTTLKPHRERLHRLEQRIPSTRIQEIKSRYTSDILTPIIVSRAASDAASLEDFYVTGMQTSLTLSIDTDAVSRRCFRWSDTGVDICFTTRDDSTTSGDFTPKDFEDMLNTVHTNLLLGQPNCGLDQWLDNHYAIDLDPGTDMNYVVEYLEANSDVAYYCQEDALHYVIDPTGWAFQCDFFTQTTPSGCVQSDDDNENPACNPGICNV